MTAAMAPTQPLNATDLCDRCGAQAYVRVVLPGSGELLFCAHHNRQHAEALAKMAVEIQDETDRLSRPRVWPTGKPPGWPDRPSFIHSRGRPDGLSRSFSHGTRAADPDT